VALQTAKVIDRLAARGITLTLTDDARTLLGNLGYDPIYGARPLKRVIQKQLVDKLAMALLEGVYGEGEVVQADAVDGEIVLKTGVVPIGEPALSL
jgi:ATP-dependent Clp protease ATP-binding subunit ClpB